MFLRSRACLRFFSGFFGVGNLIPRFFAYNFLLREQNYRCDIMAKWTRDFVLPTVPHSQTRLELLAGLHLREMLACRLPMISLRQRLCDLLYSVRNLTHSLCITNTLPMGEVGANNTAILLCISRLVIDAVRIGRTEILSTSIQSDSLRLILHRDRRRVELHARIERLNRGDSFPSTSKNACGVRDLLIGGCIPGGSSKDANNSGPLIKSQYCRVEPLKL